MARYKIGLGVTGGIAAYKAVEVMRQLQKAGCEVRVAMTRHATEFVRPLTFRALTDSHVIVDDYDPENPDPIAHINFSQGIDLLLIVPATANIIAKFASGVADDFLTSTYLASMAPVLIAPAMNTTMWEQPATQRNIAQLRSDGVKFVEPVVGELACKTVGTGKLEDVENIVRQALDLLSARGTTSTDLAGERFLITVGGTREAIDPVRFISNHSSGKMGFAMAEAAAARGADVTVVAGVTSVEPPNSVKVIRAVSAADMHKAVMDELPNATVFVGAAAVADYAPANAADAKIKKDGRDTLTLELKKTPDILGEVASKRHGRLIVVGFAAETNDVVEFARSKLEKKKLDIVVANDVSKPGAGFNADTNIVSILTASDTEDFPVMPKRVVADRVCDAIKRFRGELK
ncbi:MAG: bifunctional phosphopantothenoylcysteine decarboxylase/phosphopantothenate synthase [Acidobacteria bacterium OLB17]|nr:MAG: bifunctional phosphopantothenoylcysteine decarboxylase/phosphopantothenate synthase [Acidobacteria bacterium OLB17]MCZ2389751.1 bifunctional phosphopantothenoylcysteine decarboxylase/phosphopantothenate--cysteine ligase CoaBC [Acidobacteriota bacterium]